MEILRSVQDAYQYQHVFAPLVKMEAMLGFMERTWSVQHCPARTFGSAAGYIMYYYVIHVTHCLLPFLMSSPTSVVLQQADYDKKVKESQSQENASRRKAYAFSLCVDNL